MQFASEMKQLKTQLEQAGWEVLTPDLSEAAASYRQLPAAEKQIMKKNFILAHFDRIKKGEAILVVNYDKKGIKGYIGSNTLMEIGVAAAAGKKIYILNELGPQACEEEVTTLATKFLNGDVSTLS